MLKEILTTITLLLITTAFFVSSNLKMPMQLTSSLIIALVLVFIAYASFIWKEKPADEREAFNQMKYGRISFLVGTLVLLIGIILQTINGEIDSWLVLTLSAMLISKIAGLVINKHN